MSNSIEICEQSTFAFKEIHSVHFELLKRICNEIESTGQKELTQDAVHKLFKIYGEWLLEKAIKLIDEGNIEYLVESSSRTIFKVEGSSGHYYTILPQVNLCQCHMFKFKVITRNEHLTCKHVLGCALAKALGLVAPRNVSQITFQLSHLGEDEDVPL